MRKIFIWMIIISMIAVFSLAGCNAEAVEEEGEEGEAAILLDEVEDGVVEEGEPVVGKPINENPIANPGGPYTVTAGEELTFDGSASSDSDGEITQYTWDFGGGSTGSGVSPTHTYTEKQVNMQ